MFANLKSVVFFLKFVTSLLSSRPIIYFFPLGNGGKAGNIKIRWNNIKGTVVLKSCGGKGAPPARNGQGGQGKRLDAPLPGGRGGGGGGAHMEGTGMLVGKFEFNP